MSVRTRPWGPLRYPVLVAALALASSLALWLRIPPVARDTLWAEDGRLFLEGAQRSGLGDVLVPYAGYLQVVPRLIAGAVATLPVGGWAYGMTAGACLVSGLVAALVFVCAATVVPSVVPRLMLASVTVLLPLGPRDVFGTPTNLHTVLLWGLAWSLFAFPTTRRALVAVSAAGLLCGLSEIQAVLLVPLLAIRACSVRGRLIVLGPALGIAAQVVATIASPRAAPRRPPVPVLSLLEGYLVNAVVPLFRPIGGVGAVLPTWGLWAAGASVASVVVGAAVAWRWLAPWTRTALVTAMLLGPVVYAGSVIVNPAPYYDYAQMSRTALAHAWLTRYGVSGGMFLAASLIIVADALLRAGRLRVVSTTALVALALSLTVFFVPSWTRRSDGPQWAPQVSAAVTACEAHPSWRTVSLRETLGWRVPVSCGRLVAGL